MEQTKYLEITLDKPLREYPEDYVLDFTCPGCGRKLTLHFYMLDTGNFVVGYDMDDPCTCEFEIEAEMDGNIIAIWATPQKEENHE